MKISTATSVFVNYKIEDALEQIIQAGYDGIDFWCGRPHLYRKDYSPEALSLLRRRLKESGLRAVSFLPAFFRYPFSLSSPSAVTRAESVSYMRDTIDNAVALGCGSVLVVPTHSLHGQATGDAHCWFVEGLAEVSNYAEGQGIRLGIEILYPALSDYMHTTDQALEVIREIRSPCQGIVLDSGHLNLSGEDVERAIRNSGECLLQVHVNDNDGRRQQNNIPGDGCFVYPGLIRLLKEVCYNGFLTVEIGWQYSFDPVPAAAQALAKMRAYLAAEEVS